MLSINKIMLIDNDCINQPMKLDTRNFSSKNQPVVMDFINFINRRKS